MSESAPAPRHFIPPTATMQSLVQHIRFQDLIGQQKLHDIIEHNKGDEAAITAKSLAAVQSAIEKSIPEEVKARVRAAGEPTVQPAQG